MARKRKPRSNPRSASLGDPRLSPEVELPRETPAYADQELIDASEQVFFVRHEGNGQWCFRHRDHLAVGDSALVPTTLGEMLDLHPTIRGVADLPRGYQAWTPEYDGRWERNAIPTGPTYLVQFEATPRPGHAEDDIAGAFVNCWIRANSIESAIEIARAEIDSDGWITDEPENARETDLHDCEGDGAMYFQQAQVDGVVLVIYSYPIAEEDD